MDPTKSVHPPHSTQPHSFAPVTSPLNSNNFTSTVAQASNQFGIQTNPAVPTTQAISAPSQPNPTFPSQHTMAPSQSFTQVLNGSSHTAGIQTTGIQAAQGIISDVFPRSEPAPAQQAGTNNYPHQVSGLGGPAATTPFLQDFSLVAEAAKRAQLSIVIRDLESVTL
ncbi:hypothetical protein N7495_009289 [Penicillium taxi]|uniref:uncharacterized protein n=1 Tax=Penicillium taxi TaxID=168475 RepID=UPI002545AE96|nr:uncharacterized protein N7495_009289 [Penicillium taxi]KAJ5884779.1 hypothetical protein N7495_009289 [Penicillium taxi]